MAAVSFSGLNGIDFGSIIDATITEESAPLNLLQQQQTDDNARDSALASLATGLGTMESQADALNSSSLFTSATASSSNSAVGAATAGSEAVAGDYALHIDQLAKAQVTASTTGYATATTVAADGGSLSFTINGGTTTPINITASTTLTDLRDAINTQNSGVVASIVNTGTTRKLVLSSASTGAASGFTVNNTLTNSTGPALAFAVGQSPASGNSQVAQDAAFTVNGLDFTSASNTTTDAIPGLAVTLSGAGDSTLTVAPDNSSVETSLKAFVATYNQLRQFANSQNTVNTTTGERGPLANDSVMRQTLGDLRDVLFTPNANGGQYSYLSDIGISVDQSGNLQFDEAAYTDAMTSHPDDVQKLLQGTGSVNGVFGDMKSTLQNLDGATGLIKSTRDSLATTLTGDASQIAAAQLRLDLRKTQLQQQFSAADAAISQLNAMTGQLSQLGTPKLF